MWFLVIAGSQENCYTSALHLLYIRTLPIIICGDININYLMESEKKNQLDNLLLSCNIIALFISQRDSKYLCYCNR